MSIRFSSAFARVLPLFLLSGAYGCGAAAAQAPSPAPTPTPPPVLVQGTLAIRQSFAVDLDAGVTENVSNDAMDFRFIANTATDRFLFSVTTILAIYGRELPPTKAGCEAAIAFAAPPSLVPIEVASLGTHFCVRTSERRIARFVVVAAAGPSPGLLVVDYVTYQ
jgi:hypothetical protein